MAQNASESAAKDGRSQNASRPNSASPINQGFGGGAGVGCLPSTRSTGRGTVVAAGIRACRRAGLPARRRKPYAKPSALKNSTRLSQSTPVPGGKDAALYVRQRCLTLQRYGLGGVVGGCFTFNSMCRSRSCLGSTVLGESVIRHVPFAVFGNAMTCENNSAYSKSLFSVRPRDGRSVLLSNDSFLQLANVFQFLQLFLQGHKLLVRQHNKLTLAVLAQNFRMQGYHTPRFIQTFTGEAPTCM